MTTRRVAFADWGYFAGLITNSLFSGSDVLVVVMIQKLYAEEPDLAAKYVGLTMSTSVLGAAIGAIWCGRALAQSLAFRSNVCVQRCCVWQRADRTTLSLRLPV